MQKKSDLRPSSSSGLTLIIGQGISGTFLSYYLQKNNSSFIVIDESKPNTASKAASGIINPVTGRRIVKTWMIDELMGFAKNAYQEIGKQLTIDCITETKIIDFFPTPQMRNAFLERFEDDKTFLQLPADENDQRHFFKYDFGYGKIEPVFLIDINDLLSSYRKKLKEEKVLLEEKFDINELQVSDSKIQYKNITADRIIFCDGIESFSNPYFKNLPFAPNKGEALIVEIEGFPDELIYKKGMNIVPLKNNLFWVGSSYEWEFENDQPNKIFRERTELILLDWLKVPFKIVDHISSVRPATLERRPFVGFHPVKKNVGILNGMGTKGCSLAPFFARQLTENIIHQSPIHREADITRFAGIFRRSER
ncbi:MAG: FAD-binding oxidoreductase [Bacteroidetes bacterium]|nr:FAD-binding oxidoreductase [Bacteroidota bacterium]